MEKYRIPVESVSWRNIELLCQCHIITAESMSCKNTDLLLSQYHGEIENYCCIYDVETSRIILLYF